MSYRFKHSKKNSISMHCLVLYSMNELQSLRPFSRIIAAKNSEKSVSLTDRDIQIFQEGKKTKGKKTKIYVFSGFGNSISCCRVQPCCFCDLHTVDKLTRITPFAGFFEIFVLIISSFLRICWSMKTLASIDSFLGLTKRGKFGMEPVQWSFLTKWGFLT